MKTFRTTGTGNEQTLSEIESDKIPIYPSVQDIEDDLANLEEGQIVATPDTGNEVAQPVDVVEKDNLHAVTSNAVSESLSYSTTEQKTGGYWIDGKPIYRQVFMTTTLFSVGTSWVNTNFYLPNCDFLIEGKILRDNTTYPAVIGGTVNIDIANNYRIQVASFMNNNNCCGVILEYTKTTD